MEHGRAMLLYLISSSNVLQLSVDHVFQITRRGRVIKVENTTVCGRDSVICFALLWSLGKSCYLLYFYKETSGSVTVWLTFDLATFSFYLQRHMLAAVVRTVY